MVRHFEFVEVVAPLSEVPTVVEVIHTLEDCRANSGVLAVVEYPCEIVLVLEPERTPPEEVKDRFARDWALIYERLDPTDPLPHVRP